MGIQDPNSLTGFESVSPVVELDTRDVPETIVWFFLQFPNAAPSLYCNPATKKVFPLGVQSQLSNSSS